MPRRSGYPRGEEVESRGWRRGAPQSPSPSSFGAPQGNNKIYKCDAVFRIGEINANDQNQTQIPYKITKDISRTQFDKPTASQTTEQVRLPNKFGYRTSSVSLYCKYAEAARRGTGCHGILVPAAPLRDCNFPKGTRANPGIKIHFLFTQSGRKSAGFPVYYM